MAMLDISETDYDTMRLLLYIQHLETDLITRGCAMWQSGDFADAGFESSLYFDICRIADEKNEIVMIYHSLLESVAEPIIEECQYQWAWTGPRSWIDLAIEVGMVATSAYLGTITVSLTP